MTDKVREYCRKRYEKIYKPAYDEWIKFYPFTTADLHGEQWKRIEGFDAYQVSNYGRIKSFRKGKPKILKPALHKGGRLFVNLTRGGRGFVHRFVATAFIPNPENKPQVDHINGDKFNNCVNNLRWATKLENEQFSWQLGLRKSGENHHNARLTVAQIDYIRSNPDNLTGEELAIRLGVSAGHISSIQTGKHRKFESGDIRNVKYQRVPDNIRAQICAEYQKGVRGCGAPALGKKYGLHPSTILRIVHEQD